MTPTGTGVVVFACLLGGAFLGMYSRTRIPERFLDGESKDIVRLAMGLTATMTALVLGLVTASSKSSFDSSDTALKQSVVELLTIDRLLARYGPETKDIREGIRRGLELRGKVLRGEDGSAQSLSAGVQTGEGILSQIHGLAPKTDEQQWLKAKALEASNIFLRMRWSFLLDAGSSPMPFLIILVAWLTLLFGSFGLFAPRNWVAVLALAFSSFSVASAIFLILELDTPFTGVIKISDAPIRYALSNMAL